MYQDKNLCFEVENFKDKGKAYENLHKFIDILLDQEQVVKIWSDGVYICVEYDYDDPDIAETSLEWIDLSKEYVGVYGENKIEKDTENGQEDDGEVPPPENIKFFEKNDKMVS